MILDIISLIKIDSLCLQCTSRNTYDNKYDGSIYVNRLFSHVALRRMNVIYLYKKVRFCMTKQYA